MSIPYPTTATAQDLKRLVLAQCKEYIHSQSVRVLSAFNLCLLLHAVPGDDEREVRLIFAGKLLAPPHARICSPSPASSDAGPSFSIRDGAVVHAVISAKKSGAAAVPCICSSSILNVLSVGGRQVRPPRLLRSLARPPCLLRRPPRLRPRREASTCCAPRPLSWTSSRSCWRTETCACETPGRSAD